MAITNHNWHSPSMGVFTNYISIQGSQMLRPRAFAILGTGCCDSTTTPLKPSSHPCALSRIGTDVLKAQHIVHVEDEEDGTPIRCSFTIQVVVLIWSKKTDRLHEVIEFSVPLPQSLFKTVEAFTKSTNNMFLAGWRKAYRTRWRQCPHCEQLGRFSGWNPVF